MELVFILIEPQVPANIGACARAIKTMGHQKLRLINPCNHLDEAAFTLAHGSHDVLQCAEVFTDYRNAFHGLDLIIGTSAKPRSVHREFFSVEALPDMIKEKGSTISRVGIVFGTEESGLPNHILADCHIMSFIPMKAAYPSLNLAQAVMLYAYTFSEKLSWHKLPDTESPVSERAFQEMIAKAVNVLENMGIEPGTALFHRIMERISLLGETDVHLILSVMKHISPDQSGDRF